MVRSMRIRGYRALELFVDSSRSGLHERRRSAMKIAKYGGDIAHSPIGLGTRAGDGIGIAHYRDQNGFGSLALMREILGR